MGASVAILLAAQSAAVRAVVADSPFTGIAEVVAHNAARRRLPARLVVPMADALTGWRYGYRFGAVRPVEVIAALREALPQAQIEFDPGYTPAEAVLMTKRTDLVIAFGIRVEGEGFDNADFSLPWGRTR